MCGWEMSGSFTCYFRAMALMPITFSHWSLRSFVGPGLGWTYLPLEPLCIWGVLSLPVRKDCCFQVGHPEVGTDLCWPMCVCRCSACLWLSQFSMKQWVKSFNTSEDSVLHQRGENSQNCGYFSLNIFPNEVSFASVLATKNTKDMR